MRIFFLVCIVAAVSAKFHPLSDEFIDEINQKQSSWKAGRNFPEGTSLEHLKRLCGVLRGNSSVELPRWPGKVPVGWDPPKYFDGRDEWPKCPSIGEIQDQGSCGSCWALAPASVMTDRACIYTGGSDKLKYSARDILTCCKTCGNGCEGGFLQPAFEYWKNTGVVSGGGYGSKEGCRPYPVPECQHYTEGLRPPCEDTYPTPSCKQECISAYGGIYEQDRRFAEYVYSRYLDVHEMKYDISENGPMAAAIDVYEDFFHYKSGVYKHTGEGEPVGVHAFRIIGWGSLNDEDFWLAANSWNEDWGDHGFFKILLGSDECGVESMVVGGSPLYL